MTEQASLLYFDEFCDLLLPLGALNSPAELHGLLCGKLCGGAELSADDWQKAAWELLDVVETPDPDTQAQILALYQQTHKQLHSGDYDLQPFLPDDDADIEQRTQALSQWCHGFLSGFGSAGIDPNAEFSSEQADALRDLAAIVQVTVDADDATASAEENQLESDYLELVEYVRMVAMNFNEDQLQTAKGGETIAASPDNTTFNSAPSNKSLH